MSDPVTNIEIEDVLSSIRRLVAEGGRSKSAPKPAEKTAEETSDRFVLTPALRVADAAPDTTNDHTPKATAPLNLGVPVSVPDPLANIRTPRPSLEETIAELEAAVTDRGDDFEPDGSEVIAPPAFSLTSFPALDDVEDADEVASEATQDSAGHRLTASALDVVPVQGDNDPAVDEPPAEGEAPTFQRHRDDVIDDDMASYLEDETVIDEAALRDIVSEILREELKGVLGERITRNVRKLVRQEVQRALSSRDLS